MIKIFITLFCISTWTQSYAQQFQVYDMELTSREGVFDLSANPDQLRLDCDSFLHGISNSSTGEFLSLSERECYELFFTLKDYLNESEQMCLAIDFETKQFDYWKAYEGCL
ncbi:hypothetical protein OAT67_05170 [Bacteriovoracaceae bacterium]|nr:hypothetical protein [Bacteriovoracaceae bacterium]